LYAVNEYYLRINVVQYLAYTSLPQYLGNGRCDGDKYNTAECNWDGGDCLEFNTNYPKCTAEYPHFIGDGVCNFLQHNTTECNWDGGDCNFYRDLPNCKVDNLLLIRDRECDLSYNYEGCGFDGGDCVFLNKKYPNCSIENLNNGDCPVGKKFLDYFPKCKVKDPSWIGDNVCDGGDYNTLECGWDGGDCVVKDYPECHVDKPDWIGDGICDTYGEYNTEVCGWDGGDCPA
jgi:hypothetical protein